MEIGSKIKEIRKQKGWSQEVLAEEAKINLRTIQRIENNQSDPRGKTLQLLCDALGAGVEEIADHGKKVDKSYMVFFHLSVLSFVVLPGGNIIVPLILWIANKDKIVGLKKIGANVLNYQISWSIVFFLCFIALAIFKFQNSGINISTTFFYTVIGLTFLNLIIPVFLAIKTKADKDVWKYPKLITFVK